MESVVANMLADHGKRIYWPFGQFLFKGLGLYFRVSRHEAVGSNVSRLRRCVSSHSSEKPVRPAFTKRTTGLALRGEVSYTNHPTDSA